MWYVISPPKNEYLHSTLTIPNAYLPLVEILLTIVEVCIYNISTRRSLNQAHFDKISKSGGSGGSGGSLHTLATYTEAEAKDYDVNDNRPANDEGHRDNETKIKSIYRLGYSDN
jgi:hypothetical protein